MPTRRRGKSSPPSSSIIDLSPLWPPELPLARRRKLPNGRSRSSPTTRISGRGVFQHAAILCDRGAALVHVRSAASTRTTRSRGDVRLPREVFLAPLVHAEAPREFVDDHEPTLWRVRAYSGPGLPSPTMRRVRSIRPPPRSRRPSEPAPASGRAAPSSTVSSRGGSTATTTVSAGVSSVKPVGSLTSPAVT